MHQIWSNLTKVRHEGHLVSMTYYRQECQAKCWKLALAALSNGLLSQPKRYLVDNTGGYSPLIGLVATILALIGYMAPILAFDWSGSTSTRTTSRRRSRRTEIRLTTPASRKWASCFITHKLNVEIWNVNFVDTRNKYLLVDILNMLHYCLNWGIITDSPP